MSQTTAIDTTQHGADGTRAPQRLTTQARARLVSGTTVRIDGGGVVAFQRERGTRDDGAGAYRNLVERAPPGGKQEDVTLGGRRGRAGNGRGRVADGGNSDGGGELRCNSVPGTVDHHGRHGSVLRVCG